MVNTFKVYDIGNLGSSRSFVYLGGTYISKIFNTDKSKSDFTTFLFASLVGGRNVRIDQATEKDPYIFIDSRFYTFKPYSYYVDFSNNTPLQTLEDMFASNDVFLKTIIKSIENSSGDITINTKNIEGDSKLVIHTDKLKNELILKAAEYNLKNTTDIDSKSLALKILTKKSKDTDNNTVFHVNKLIEGNCLKLEQILEFTWEQIISSSSSSSSSLSFSTFSNSSNSDTSSNSSSSKQSSSSSLVSSESYVCCDLMRVVGVGFYTVETVDANTQIDFNEDYTSEDLNLRQFISKNVKGRFDIHDTSLNLTTRVNFPEQLHNIATYNYFWSYYKTTIINERTAIVNYHLRQDDQYATGVRLYGINYTKESPNLIRHEIVTPKNNVIDTYNSLSVIIPVDDFNVTGFSADLSNLTEIYTVLENNFDFKIKTDYNGNIQTLYFNTSSFIRNSIQDIGDGLYKATYLVEDTYDMSDKDGILEIIVEKCYIIQNNNKIGDLNITIESSCDFFTPPLNCDPMIIKVDTTNISEGSTPNTHFKLPLTPTGNYNFNVDWGDGNTDTITSWNDAAVDHNYEISGSYNVKIGCECSEWRFDNTGDKLKVLDIIQWGNGIRTTRLNEWYGCANLNPTATDAPILSGNISGMFRDCINLADGFLTMCLPNKSQKPASNNCQINTSPAVYNSVTLSATNSANDVNIKFYSSKVSRIVNVGNTSGLRITTLSDYPNLAKVRFTTTGILPAGLSTGVDYYLVRIANVDNNYVAPNFRISTSPTGTPTINYTNNGSGTHTVIEQNSTDGWVLGAANTQYYIRGYESAGVSVQAAVGEWYTRWVYREVSASNKNVYYVAGKAAYASAEAAAVETERTDLPVFITNNCVLVGRIIQKHPDLGDNITESICAVISNKVGAGAQVSIADWDVSNVTSMEEMFAFASMFDTVLDWDAHSCINFAFMLRGCNNYNQNLGVFLIDSMGTLSGINMVGFLLEAHNFNNGDIAFRTANGTKPLILNTEHVTDISVILQETLGFNQYVGDWNTTNVLYAIQTFCFCYSFNNGKTTGDTTAPMLWDLSSCLSSTFAFSNAKVFDQDCGTFGMQAATNMMRMFGGNGLGETTRFNNGGSASINNWRPSLCQNFNGMFYYSNRFNQPLGDWTTGAATDFTEMFIGCEKLKQNFGTWDIANVINLDQMFSGCNLNEIGTSDNYDALLDGWSTQAVKQNIFFSAGNSKFGAGAVADKLILTGIFNWTIIDGGRYD